MARAAGCDAGPVRGMTRQRPSVLDRLPEVNHDLINPAVPKTSGSGRDGLCHRDTKGAQYELSTCRTAAQKMRQVPRNRRSSERLVKFPGPTRRARLRIASTSASPKLRPQTEPDHSRTRRKDPDCLSASCSLSIGRRTIAGTMPLPLSGYALHRRLHWQHGTLPMVDVLRHAGSRQ